MHLRYGKIFIQKKRKLLLRLAGYPLKFPACLLLSGRHKNGYLWAAFLCRQPGRIQSAHYRCYPLRGGELTFLLWAFTDGLCDVVLYLLPESHADHFHVR